MKRVAMNFSWPLNKTWGGFLNPYYGQSTNCPDCKNGYDRAGGRLDANAALFHEQWYGNAPFDPAAYGAEVHALTREHPAYLRAVRNVDQEPSFYMNPEEKQARAAFRRGAMEGFPHDEPIVPLPSLDKQRAIDQEARRLFALWRDQWCHHLVQADVDALVAGDRLWDFTRRPRTAEQAAMLEAQADRGGSRHWMDEPNGHHPTAAEVNAWSFDGFGHDAINAGLCVEARCKRESVPHTCARCKGTGNVWPTAEIERLCEEWEPTEPLAGEGYQLWEDCSEGSPVSPVFATIDELCEWCAEHATTFADFRASKEYRAEITPVLIGRCIDEALSKA